MEDPKKVRFHYIKSAAYRVVHCDGAYGGITPRGQIFIGAYCERSPIPMAATFALNPQGIEGLPFDTPENYNRATELADRLVEISRVRIDPWKNAETPLSP